MSDNSQRTMVKTPLKRLVPGIFFGQIMMTMALLTPLSLLLTFKVTDIVATDKVAATLGMITGTGALFALIANPIGGAISDRTQFKFGRRRTWILLGSLLGGLSLLGIGLSKSILMVMVFWCCAQVFFNFALASYTALIPDQVDESHRGSISGILGLVVPVSIVLGMVIATSLTKSLPIIQWGIFSLIAVVGAIIACFIIKDGKVIIERPKNTKINFIETISNIYPNPRKYPAYTWGWFTRFFVSLAYFSSSYNTLMLMQRYHLTQEKTSQTATLLSLASMLCLAVASVIGGVMSDKFRKQKPFVIASAAVVTVGLLMNAFAPSLLWIILGNSLAGFGYGIFLAVDMALISRILPKKEDAAKDFGIMNIANTITQSIVPFIGPALLAIGGWKFFYTFLALFGILSAITVLPIPELASKKKLTEN